MARSSIAALVAVAIAIVGSGCGECEFSIIPKSETCSAGCATLNRADIAEGVICADYDCTADEPCASGFQCVSVGKPVCLPSCDDDSDCEDGLVCTDQIDGVSGGDT
ncbi:MAG: hypothetical protein JNK04_23710, partial [Myxococcales bacterium]|nr:hypothetical protein [Myxococcales bacterium]